MRHLNQRTQVKRSKCNKRKKISVMWSFDPTSLNTPH